MADKIITRPATDEYRENWERVFRKPADGYEYVTYEIEGATRTPEMRAALERSMRKMP